ncbi:hypothetical protein F5Y12DRAFT_713325 [Xylaria sp. FL1777]|nr:hypothetical protein F5Y12DRAFT_713325 [Xylaria sp. FL1777]
MSPSSIRVRRCASPEIIPGTMPWGCQVVVDPETNWPETMAIRHYELGCRCYDEDDPPLGAGTIFARDVLYYIAFEYYYSSDPVRYNAFVCNDMVAYQAERHCFNLEGRLIWDIFPDSWPLLPWWEGEE